MAGLRCKNKVGTRLVPQPQRDQQVLGGFGEPAARLAPELVRLGPEHEAGRVAQQRQPQRGRGGRDGRAQQAVDEPRLADPGEPA